MWNQLLFWRLSSWLMCWSYKWTSLRHSSAIYTNLPGSQSNQNKLQDWESQTQIVSDVAQQNVESTPLLEVVILVNVLKLQVNIIATHRLRRRLPWSQAIWLSKVQNQSSVQRTKFLLLVGFLHVQTSCIKMPLIAKRTMDWLLSWPYSFSESEHIV